MLSKIKSRLVSTPAEHEVTRSTEAQVALVMGGMLLLLRLAGASIWTHLLSKPIVDSFLTAGALVIAASQVLSMAYVVVLSSSHLPSHATQLPHYTEAQTRDHTAVPALPDVAQEPRSHHDVAVDRGINVQQCPMSAALYLGRLPVLKGKVGWPSPQNSGHLHHTQPHKSPMHSKPGL